jgi:hypothetical protein
MKKLLLALALFMGIVYATTAQKKDQQTETQISVHYPVFSVIYTEGEDADGNPLGMADLQIHDRKGQTNDVSINRLSARAHGNDPVSPKVKLIFMEELGGFNFRFAETMEERARVPDGVNTLLVDYRVLLEAWRVKYNN